MVNTAFTIFRIARYDVGTMLLFVAAIAALSPQPDTRAAAPAVQATATVRILSGIRLSLGKAHAGQGFNVRDTMIRAAGVTQSARLIEFE